MCGMYTESWHAELGGVCICARVFLRRTGHEVWFHAHFSCMLCSTDPNPSHGSAPCPGVCVCVL